MQIERLLITNGIVPSLSSTPQVRCACCRYNTRKIFHRRPALRPVRFLPPPSWASSSGRPVHHADLFSLALLASTFSLEKAALVHCAKSPAWPLAKYSARANDSSCVKRASFVEFRPSLHPRIVQNNLKLPNEAQRNQVNRRSLSPTTHDSSAAAQHKIPAI